MPDFDHQQYESLEPDGNTQPGRMDAALQSDLEAIEALYGKEPLFSGFGRCGVWASG